MMGRKEILIKVPGTASSNYFFQDLLNCVDDSKKIIKWGELWLPESIWLKTTPIDGFEDNDYEFAIAWATPRVNDSHEHIFVCIDVNNSGGISWIMLKKLSSSSVDGTSTIDRVGTEDKDKDTKTDKSVETGRNLETLENGYLRTEEEYTRSEMFDFYGICSFIDGTVVVYDSTFLYILDARRPKQILKTIRHSLQVENNDDGSVQDYYNSGIFALPSTADDLLVAKNVLENLRVHTIFFISPLVHILLNYLIETV